MSIKAEQCTIGAVVFFKKNHYPLPKGKIASPLTNNAVIVEWNDGGLEKHNINLLLSEEEGTAEEQRLLDEKNRLEREFADVEASCKDRLERAAELIREASILADSKGKYLIDMYEAVRPLERAMDEAGWSTSSWHC